MEGGKQTNKSMQAELVYVRGKKPTSTQSEEELAEWKFCVAVPCLALPCQTGALDPCIAGVLGPETAKAGATIPAVAWRRVH